MINRIKEFIENQGISISAFEQKISASDGMIRRAIRNNTDIQSKWIAQISDNYPDLNLEWLISGKGDMLKSYMPPIFRTKSIDKKFDEQKIPLYDIEAAAGLKSLLSGGTQNIIDSLRIPNLSKVDGALPITGDSMYPLLKSGDIVIFKQIHNLEYLHFGNIYLIDYEIDGDEYFVIKYINESSRKGFLKLVSYNEHYRPIDIPTSSISAIALVKASIRYNTMQ